MSESGVERTDEQALVELARLLGGYISFEKFRELDHLNGGIGRALADAVVAAGWGPPQPKQDQQREDPRIASDAAKLRTLADWFDVQDAKRAEATSSEVQRDLRRIANLLDRPAVGVGGPPKPEGVTFEAFTEDEVELLNDALTVLWVRSPLRRHVIEFALDLL